MYLEPQYRENGALGENYVSLTAHSFALYDCDLM